MPETNDRHYQRDYGDISQKYQQQENIFGHRALRPPFYPAPTGARGTI